MDKDRRDFKFISIRLSIVKTCSGAWRISRPWAETLRVSSRTVAVLYSRKKRSAKRLKRYVVACRIVVVKMEIGMYHYWLIVIGIASSWRAVEWLLHALWEYPRIPTADLRPSVPRCYWGTVSRSWGAQGEWKASEGNSRINISIGNGVALVEC